MLLSNAMTTTTTAKKCTYWTRRKRKNRAINNMRLFIIDQLGRSKSLRGYSYINHLSLKIKKKIGQRRKQITIPIKSDTIVTSGVQMKEKPERKKEKKGKTKTLIG